MKSIFDPETQREIRSRIGQLTPETRGQWGKMDAAQMLCHCTRGIKVPLGEFSLKPSWLRFIGRFFRSMATSDKPFGKNSPTAPEFIVADSRIFEEEKKNLLACLDKLAEGQSAIVFFNNGFFGPLTAAEWGQFLYKHTDHHLTQFGV